MKIADLLLADYDHEIENTRRTLALIPADKGDFKPHEKSMPMGRLAEHTARMGEFGNMVMNTEDMDLATAKWPEFHFNGPEQLLKHLQESSSQLKQTLNAMSDEDLEKVWTMRFGNKIIIQAPKYLVFRTMFLNHLVHHRAQLGVYLRLLNLPVPGLYGPSADEPFQP
ncbi:MAG: DinB family protein [Acidobacteria bacterium]|nr:DinB family protein [Acidobacteriota bacterium]